MYVVNLVTHSVALQPKHTEPITPSFQLNQNYSKIPTITKKLAAARETQLKKKKEMLETVKYLIGSAGASGYGSKSTAEQVTESCGDLSSITAIITGNQS